jgi:hypothetical protein
VTRPVDRRSRGAPDERDPKRRRSSRVPGGHLEGTPRHNQRAEQRRKHTDGSRRRRWRRLETEQLLRVLRVMGSLWLVIPADLREHMLRLINETIN